jgi:hypothetical protein
VCNFSSFFPPRKMDFARMRANCIKLSNPSREIGFLKVWFIFWSAWVS